VAAACERAARGRASLPLHLLGHSLGGALVLDSLAAPGSAGVASATVLSAPIELRLGRRAALAELRGFLRPATLTQREHYGLWGLVPAVGPLRRGAFPFRFAAELRGGGPLGYVQRVSALLEELDLERAASRVCTPVLLVYGAADALVPPEQGRRLHAAIPGSRVFELPRASHWEVAWSPLAVDAVVAWFGADGGEPA
jgi:pimeloyl-ACP methyl ester carboxylesterase